LPGASCFQFGKKDWEHAMFNTLILSLVASSPAITSTPGPELVINEQRNVAYEELSSGKAAEAAQSLETAVQRDPRSRHPDQPGHRLRPAG
jgi:Tfp pilus assembly protein PilF